MGAPYSPPFTLKESADYPSRGQHTTKGSSWGLVQSGCTAETEAGAASCRDGRDLRGSQRNEPQILPAIFPQLLGCTKIKGKHKNQVGNGSEVVNLSRLQQWFWEPKAGGQGLPGERV